MKNNRIFCALLGLLLLLSGCDLVHDNWGGSDTEPWSVQLKADRNVIYNLSTFSLEAEVPSNLTGVINLTWFEGNNPVPLTTGTNLSLNLARYVTTPTEYQFTIEASDSITTVSETINITVLPYTNSDSSSITLTNNKGMNIAEVFVYTLNGMADPITSPLLGGDILADGESIQFLNLPPGWYMIGSENAAGQSSGLYGNQIIAGANLISLQ